VFVEDEYITTDSLEEAFEISNTFHHMHVTNSNSESDLFIGNFNQEQLDELNKYQSYMIYGYGIIFGVRLDKYENYTTTLIFDRSPEKESEEDMSI
jgi:hypothetical protein